VSPWLISSLGLPLVSTTGRLMIIHLLAHPAGAVTLTAAVAMVMAVFLTLARRQRRHVSRRASSS
jgi:dolichyl-phosphate-mannose--protein O-mannosyl transferase